MKTIAIINLKGGVAKTVSSVTIAYLLAQKGYKVLLVDNDKQGNASKMVDRYEKGNKGTAYIMTERLPIMTSVIQQTDYEGLDIITADMRLLKANLIVQMDMQRPQQDRIKKALGKVSEYYDFCIIDNAPDVNISTTNALVAADYVMVPLAIDEFALDGLEELMEQVESVKEGLNPELEVLGCFVTRYVRSDQTEKTGMELLQGMPYPVFDTCIRRTNKVTPATFFRIPVPVYSSGCAASRDYAKLTEELLKKIGEKHEQ